MTSQEIFDKLKEKFEDSIQEFRSDKPVDPFIVVSAEKIKEVSSFLRDYEEFLFDQLCCLSGVDFGDGKLGTVYHLYSFEKKHKIVLKVIVSKDKPEIPSVSNIWLTANWHEREAFDLIGINFTGHPDLRRILLPDDWEGNPLRKDYQVQEFYNGMKVPY
jgi:NADH-quinone oxidoreductase subunit C